MEKISEELEKIEESLIQKFNPLAIILFGSYARNTQNEESDIDIAVISFNTEKNEIYKVKQELEEIVLKDIDLVNLGDKNISDGFKYEILMNGKVLYCQDSYEFEMYKINALREYLEFNESRQEIIDRIKNGGTIYGK